MSLTRIDDVRLPILSKDATDDDRRMLQALYDQFRDTNQRLAAIETALGMAPRQIPNYITPSIGVYPLAGVDAVHYIESIATGTASAAAGVEADCDTGTAQVNLAAGNNVSGNANANVNSTVQTTGAASTNITAANNGTGNASTLVQSVVSVGGGGTAITGIVANNGSAIAGMNITAVDGGEAYSTMTGPLALDVYTVATLPSAATVGTGALAVVSDSANTLILGFGAVAVGGGANVVPVFSDGANWIVG